MNDTPSFGYWVRRRRKALDLTQHALAQQVGCASATIKKIEQDERRPSLAMVKRMLDILQVPENERVAVIDAARGIVSPIRLTDPKNVSDSKLQSLIPLSSHTVPVPLAPLIGREVELAQLMDLLMPVADRHVTGTSPQRIVTIIGMGGIGKTHLAQWLMAALATHFADGVLFVPLAAIGDASQLLLILARQVGVQATTRSQIFTQLVSHFKHRQQLIVLDNFEQVIDAATELQTLLQHTPNLKLLVTSRVSLNIQHEHLFNLNPLSASNAVDLLMLRSQQLGIAFNGDKANDVLLAIATRLMGLPLALELAAGQLRLYSPNELLAKLDTPLSTLSARNPTTRQREFVLRDMLNRSYQLLSRPVQTLLRWMGIFVSGATFGALQTLLAETSQTQSKGNSPDNTTAIEDGLLTLIESSLVRHEIGANGKSRYVMHDLVGEFAREQLRQQSELARVAWGHMRVFITWAEAQREAWLRHELSEIDYFGVLQTDQDNVLAALRWAQNEVAQTTQLTAAEACTWVVRLIHALDKGWLMRGYLPENEAVLAWAFAHRQHLDPQMRATLCYRVCQLLWYQRDVGPVGGMTWVYEAVEEGFELAQAASDLPWMAWYQDCRASIAISLGEIERAEAILQVAWDQLQVAYAQALAQSPILPKNIYGVLAGNTHLRSQASELKSNYAGMVHWTLESLNFCKQGQLETFLFLRRFLHLARAYIGQGDFAAAKLRLVEAYTLCHENRNHNDLPMLWHGVAYWFERQNNFERMAFFMGMAEAWRVKSGIIMGASGKVAYDATIARLQIMLASETIYSAWQHGRSVDTTLGVPELVF